MTNTDREKIKEALLPCPFCGSEDIAVAHDCLDWFAACHNDQCPCTLEGYRDEQSARNAWNTRASQAATKPAGGEWLPIESAPRDGSRILLTGWHGKDVKLWRGVGYGHFYKPGNRFEYDGYQFGNPDHQPTHWQPLPAPPHTRKENGE